MALSTTQYGYIIDPMVPFTDDKGKTIKNGFVRVFVAGSSTPVVTYRNFDGATNQDLIELDNSGRTKTSVIGSKGFTYKVCVYDKHHSQESPILTVDKVSVIGANITAGAGATLVTGLDGLTTKPDGFVDASVVGTDGYVALDHTLVTDDLDTDAKVTAVENDRYIPLLNEEVNDPDSKMTLGRMWQWVLGKIKSLSTTITAFRTGDVIPVDGPNGPAKMSKDDLLKETAENAHNEGGIKTISPQIYGTASSNLDDLNNAEPNSIYVISRDSNTQTLNFPSEFKGQGELIVTKSTIPGGSHYFIFQVLRKFNQCGYWWRNYNSVNTTWTSWEFKRDVYVADNFITGTLSTNPSSLDDLKDNSVYLTVYTASTTTTTGFPSDCTIGGRCILSVYKSVIASGVYQVEQSLDEITSGKKWWRYYDSNSRTWNAWSTQGQEPLRVVTPQIYAGSASNLGDLNNATPNSIYIISRDGSTTTQNFPSDFYGEGELISSKSGIPGGSHYFIFQVLKKFNTAGYWWRRYNSVTTTWDSWAFVRDFYVGGNFITGTLRTNPSSLDNLKDNASYLTIYTATTTTTGFPTDCTIGHRGVLNVYKAIISGSIYQVEQFFSEAPSGKKWWRYYDSNSNTWSAWRTIADRHRIEIGQGKTFTTFRAGMQYAYDNGNVDVIVYPGIYDLETEFADVLPTYSGTSFFGCPIGNGMHVKFMAGAEVHAVISADDYPTNIDKIRQYFEPIGFHHKGGGSDDFVLEDAVIKSHNTRYCVHDDDGASSSPCIHKFINCRMYRENEPDVATNNFIQCIGGGLGNHSTIVVEGGYYEAKVYRGVSSINNGDIDYAQICISYHNVGSSLADAESKIFVRDVYFADRGYFMAQSYGSSEVTSKIYINGCRFGLHPLVWFGGGDSSITNFELCAYWNCTEEEEGDWSTTTSPISATYVPSN